MPYYVLAKPPGMIVLITGNTHPCHSYKVCTHVNCSLLTIMQLLNYTYKRMKEHALEKNERMTAAIHKVTTNINPNLKEWIHLSILSFSLSEAWTCACTHTYTDTHKHTPEWLRFSNVIHQSMNRMNQKNQIINSNQTDTLCFSLCLEL